MKKLYILLVAVFCFCSCQESREEVMLRLVNEWNGKEIKFPSRSVFTIQGKDTVDFEFEDADYKVVTYIDSVGCTSCKLQLYHWKEWIAEVDSLTSGNVSFLLYSHPQNILDMRYLTRRDNFVYPICFDENNELYKLNKFPSDVAFQTFLLDKGNKVIAIGNPVRNPQMKKLYIGLITGVHSAESSSKNTQLSVNQKELDFGRFSKEEKQTRSFVLTNVGKELLVVHDVMTSCGCIKVAYSKQPVRPGETLELKVIYEAEDTGYFNKSITIYCNVENSPLRLKVKGSAN